MCTFWSHGCMVLYPLGHWDEIKVHVWTIPDISSFLVYASIIWWGQSPASTWRAAFAVCSFQPSKLMIPQPCWGTWSPFQVPWTGLNKMWWYISIVREKPSMAPSVGFEMSAPSALVTFSCIVLVGAMMMVPEVRLKTCFGRLAYKLTS